MSESMRALCRIIEERPFLTLTVPELGALAAAMRTHIRVAERNGGMVNGYLRLLAKLADEMNTRRAETALRQGFEAGVQAGLGRPRLTDKGLEAIKDGDRS